MLVLQKTREEIFALMEALYKDQRYLEYKEEEERLASDPEIKKFLEKEGVSAGIVYQNDRRKVMDSPEFQRYHAAYMPYKELLEEIDRIIFSDFQGL